MPTMLAICSGPHGKHAINYYSVRRLRNPARNIQLLYRERERQPFSTAFTAVVGR